MNEKTGKARYRRKRKSSDELLRAGLGALAFSMALWFAGHSLKGRPALEAVANGLHPIVWPAFLIGFALIALHFVVKKFRTNSRHATEAVQPEEAPSRRLKTPTQQRAKAATNSVLPDQRFTPEVRLTQWSPAVFATIEWRRFEAVCEALFAQAGFETRSQSHGADGGVDIWLHSKNSPGDRPVAVVQCKHWKSQQIGVKEVREFFGVMTANGLKHGTYATSSTFSTGARAFAKTHRINAQDGAGLLALIATRTPEQQQALLEVAYEGEYWRATCASCGTKMNERVDASNSRYWACGVKGCGGRLKMNKKSV